MYALSRAARRLSSAGEGSILRVLISMGSGSTTEFCREGRVDEEFGRVRGGLASAISEPEVDGNGG